MTGINDRTKQESMTAWDMGKIGSIYKWGTTGEGHEQSRDRSG